MPESGIALLKETGAPGIYFEDFPELADFKCPEWSHLVRGRLRRIHKTSRAASAHRARNVTGHENLLRHSADDRGSAQCRSVSIFASPPSLMPP